MGGKFKGRGEGFGDSQDAHSRIFGEDKSPTASFVACRLQRRRAREDREIRKWTRGGGQAGEVDVYIYSDLLGEERATSVLQSAASHKKIGRLKTLRYCSIDIHHAICR